MRKQITQISELLMHYGLTVGTVESCTSGRIASALTLIDGASAYFRGGLVTYASDLKVSLANVSQDTIDKNDVVSWEVASEMAKGGLDVLGCDLCVSITGYAGRQGGSDKVQNGTVWICVAKRNKDMQPSYFFKELMVNETRAKNLRKCRKEALTLLQYVLTTQYTIIN